MLSCQNRYAMPGVAICIEFFVIPDPSTEIWITCQQLEYPPNYCILHLVVYSPLVIQAGLRNCAGPESNWYERDHYDTIGGATVPEILSPPGVCLILTYAIPFPVPFPFPSRLLSPTLSTSLPVFPFRLLSQSYRPAIPTHSWHLIVIA
jgi:hypothetical protein